MNREYVVPGVEHRGRAKFGGCCGCCRTFIDRFGSTQNARRPVGEVGNGWTVGNGDCSIQNLSGVKNLVMSGPDAMLIRDMRNEDFTITYIADYIPGGFTVGPYIPDEGNIIFHPEKEHRLLFNWVDKNNFDFISYWDWDELNDYTIAKVGTRENGSERFFLPPTDVDGVIVNSYTYTIRTYHRNFCYVNGVFFINLSNYPGGEEYPGSAVTYGKPLLSRFCGLGTGPQFSGEWNGNLFIVTKTTTEDQKQNPFFGGSRDVEDCKWCPRPQAGCINYIAPTYIIAEKFGDNSGITNVGGGYDSGGYSGGIGNFGVVITIDPDMYSPFGSPIPHPTAGTVRLDSYEVIGFNSYHKLYKLDSTTARDDCDAWDRLRLEPDPDGTSALGGFTIPPEGYWELTGVYEL